jgi:uncharacterized protein (TIGR02466 family)
MPIYQLFPEPVYFSKLGRSLTQKELKTIAQYKEKTKDNDGNNRTKDSYVLEHKTFKNLKKDLNKKIINYFNEIICPSNPLIPYITQSWINYTERNQFHHRHSHSNSYVSGVFYIDAKKEFDKIKFFKSGYSPFKLPQTKFNLFNSSTWWYPVESGDVVLFSSSVEHGVEIKEGINTRTSLSFNVFFKGAIGTKDYLTELILE